MKSKASLLLMEQLAMVLVFALAAALCLRIFVRADEISIQNGRQDRAVMIAQNAAELLKSGADEEDIPQDEAYPMEIQMENSGVPGLAQARIAVYYDRDTEPLFTMTTGWQEAVQ